MLLKSTIFFVLIAIALIGCINYIVPLKEKYLETKYDLFNENDSVKTEKEVSDILDSYKNIEFEKLTSSYKSFTKSEDANYINLLSDKSYKEISRNDFYKKLVGDFRIKDFVCKDMFYDTAVRNRDNKYYWLIDEKLPIAILNLQIELEKQGYNSSGFKITYGHRSPSKNELVNGARLSKHIVGQAVDIVIEDIDQDGVYTENDKNIVLEIAEKIVIGNKGGIGRYPGTRTIHLDVRGIRARWDSY